MRPLPMFGVFIYRRVTMKLRTLLTQNVVRVARFILSLFNQLLSRSKSVEKIVSHHLDSKKYWELPESEEAKLAAIGMARDAEVDTYLWYKLGDIHSIDEAEVRLIVGECFVHKKAGFGDIELHRSLALPEKAVILRLRGRLRLRPAVTIRGRYCPLYQIGHMNIFGQKVDGTRNFHNLWCVLN